MDLGGELIKAYLFQQHSRQTGSPSGTDICYNLRVRIYLTTLVVCSPEASALPKEHSRFDWKAWLVVGMHLLG